MILSQTVVYSFDADWRLSYLLHLLKPLFPLSSLQTNNSFELSLQKPWTMRLFCQFASVKVNPKQNSLRKCGCRILLRITSLFASSLERQTGLESKGKDVQVNNRHFTKLCCGAFNVPDHPGLTRILALRTGKYWSDSNKYTSYASDEEKRQLSWRIMLHFGVNRVIGKSLHITSTSWVIWWIETIHEGQRNEEIGVFGTSSQCSKIFRILDGNWVPQVNLVFELRISITCDFDQLNWSEQWMDSLGWEDFHLIFGWKGLLFLS